jgi:hypothetical protein
VDGGVEGDGEGVEVGPVLAVDRDGGRHGRGGGGARVRHDDRQKELRSSAGDGDGNGDQRRR